VNYPGGEVLFTGANVHQVAPKDHDKAWQIEYNFLTARHQENITIAYSNGDTETISNTGRDPVTGERIPLEVEPWDYLWYQFVSKVHEDEDGNKTVQKGIKSFHVAQVYERGQFNDFDIHAPTEEPVG